MGTHSGPTCHWNCIPCPGGDVVGLQVWSRNHGMERAVKSVGGKQPWSPILSSITFICLRANDEQLCHAFQLSYFDIAAMS